MIGFPLLLIPLAIYNIIAFLMPDVRFGEPLFKLALMSGAEWPVTLSDVLLAVGILLLLLEIVKGARPGAKYFTDHLLSLIVFGAAAAEFVLWPKFGTSTYFLLTALALVDFLSGVALRRRRGAAVAAAPAVSRKSARQSRAAGGRALIRACAVRRRPQPRLPNRWPDQSDARAVRGLQRGVAGSRFTWPAAGQRRATIAGRAAALIVFQEI